jgi:hypothetical protein
MSFQNQPPTPSILMRFVHTFLSMDNVLILLGLALITRGAALWSERAAWLTCGCLVLGLTLLHLIVGVTLGHDRS